LVNGEESSYVVVQLSFESFGVFKANFITAQMFPIQYSMSASQSILLILATTAIGKNLPN